MSPFANPPDPSGQSSAAVTRVGQIALRADDVPASIAFYRDALGLKHLFTVNDRLAFLECGGVRVMLSPPEKPEFDHPSSIFYYVTDDLQSAHAALAARGVPCESEPRLVAKMPDHELWMAFYRDPSRNLFALMQEKR